MFQYLEALVENKTMNFPQDLLKPMFELYCDITTMYLNQKSPTQIGHQLDLNFRNNQPSITQKIIESTLTAEMQSGVSALDQESRNEIEESFRRCEGMVNTLRSSMAPGPQQPIGYWLSSVDVINVSKSSGIIVSLTNFNLLS